MSFLATIFTESLGATVFVKSPDVLGIIDRVWFGKRKQRIWYNFAGYGRKAREWERKRSRDNLLLKELRLFLRRLLKLGEGSPPGMRSAAGLVPVVLRSTPEFLKRAWNEEARNSRREEEL